VRLTDALELVRAPNILTAPADVGMGLAVSGAAFDGSAVLLLGASALAYGGGMALNDAVDAHLDAVERPERVIPSGRISRSAAFGLGGGLLGASVVLAALAGLGPFLVALAFAAMIVFYDVRGKGTPLGPPSMAACRGLNAGMGIALGAATWGAVGAAIVLAAYVLVVTVVSSFEVTEAPKRVVQGAGLALAALVTAALVLIAVHWDEPIAGIGVLALLVLWLASPYRAALIHPAPKRIIALIGAAVLGIVLLDAAFAVAAAGLAGLLVAALFAPAFLLKRRFAGA
jgi:4-hydroxybenzoate polyprenyltransferase